jgi:hypothetical protein
MKRVIGLAALVILFAVAAGYGRSSLRTIAQKEAKYFGDPHATVTRIETARVAGARWAIIEMKGRRTFRIGCAPVGGLVGTTCHPHYLVVGVKLPSKKVGLYWGLTASQVAAIKEARRASRWLRVFPDTTNLYAGCAIPRGGTHFPTDRSLTGTCSTVAEPSDHVRRVKFTETFRISPSSKPSEADWIVTLDKVGHVQSIRVKGQPPQLWK